MKVFLKRNGVTLVGKAWQIKYLLKKYAQKYETLQDWVNANKK